ncbi:MAG TPA: YtxH domain-containing protein [Chitinophagaceae bacterium]
MKLLQPVLIGIAIGILIAPDKGSETLRKLTGKLSGFGENAKDYLSDAAENIKEKAGDIADNVKSKAKQTARKVTSKAEDLEDPAANI